MVVQENEERNWFSGDWTLRLWNCLTSMVAQENEERNYDPERWGLSVSVLTYFYWIFQAYAQRRA
jgi:hypothetical protein